MSDVLDKKCKTYKCKDKQEHTTIKNSFNYKTYLLYPLHSFKSLGDIDKVTV